MKCFDQLEVGPYSFVAKKFRHGGGMIWNVDMLIYTYL